MTKENPECEICKHPKLSHARYGSRTMDIPNRFHECLTAISEDADCPCTEFKKVLL